MPDEGKDDVVKIVPDAEGKIKADEKGKYPEVVPWDKYVGVKEMLTKAKTQATELGEKVTSLEEKLRNASPEEAGKVKTELEGAKEELKTTKEKLTTTEEELTSLKEKTLTEKRAILTKRGIPEDKVKDMSGKELDAAIVVLGHSKPAPDLSGGGGGGGELKGSPMELAQRAYEQK